MQPHKQLVEEYPEMMIGKRERVVRVEDFPEAAPVVTTPTPVEAEPVPVRR